LPQSQVPTQQATRDREGKDQLPPCADDERGLIASRQFDGRRILFGFCKLEAIHGSAASATVAPVPRERR
jgi:hypothetical protein